MQSNEDFIPNFAKASLTLRALIKHSTFSKWNTEHQTCVEHLITSFRKDPFVRYYDMKKPVYLIGGKKNRGKVTNFRR